MSKKVLPLVGAYKKCLNNYKFQIFFVMIVLSSKWKVFLKISKKILTFQFWAIFGCLNVCDPCKT